jgi:hypothetical protein
MSEPDAVPAPDPAATSQADRRAYVRLRSDLAGTCRVAGQSQEVGWPGRVRDISQGGIGLLLRHRFRPGTALEVELRGSNGNPLRTVSVQIIHATSVLVDGNQQCWLLGCSFDQPLSAEEFEQLR